jgi:hypothetical protein
MTNKFLSSHRVRSLGLIFMVMLFIACPKSHDADFQSQLNVFGVMRSDMGEQQLIIDRTYAMEDTTGYDLQNVLATMSGDTLCDTLQLMAVNGMGLFVGFHHPGEPQQTYKIMVCADGLDTLWGETTVPGVFTILFPQPGDTVFYDDTVLIKKSPGGKVYEFGLYQNDTIPSMVMSFPDFFTDSMFRFPVSELYLGEGAWRMQIAAYDSNFFNYQYQYGSNEYPQCGVNGGLGAFCSAYVNSVSFYYQP